MDSAGDIDRRITATRLLLTGPFALGLRKKKDERELYLLIEGDGFAWAVEVNPKKGGDARKFAAKVNAVAQKLAPSQDEPAAASPAVAVSTADELKKLVELRDVGALTEDEFAAQKAKLLNQ